LFDREAVRADVLTILKMTHKEPPITNEGDDVVVDVEKIRDQGLYALEFYVRGIE
jgi:hypothetical protein